MPHRQVPLPTFGRRQVVGTDEDFATRATIGHNELKSDCMSIVLPNFNSSAVVRGAAAEVVGDDV